MEYSDDGLSSCELCPRKCGADRTKKAGFCKAGDRIKIARAALHFWEEPCLSGSAGSGAIFFSGCALRCVYCQNREISREGGGREISPGRLREICFELKGRGALNINLVTPDHFAPQIRRALLPVKKELGLPVVINTGGYLSDRQLALFNGLADIYLPDFKYVSPEIAARYSFAPDYPAVAENALTEMLRQVGRPVFGENGALKSGVIVRHLILPGARKESLAVLHRLASLFSPEDFLLSLMSQYSPMPGVLPPLDRKITSFEQTSVRDRAAELGFRGWFQDRSAAGGEYIPAFDLTGV